MIHTAKTLVRNALNKFNIGITRLSRLKKLEERSAAYDDLALLLNMPEMYSSRLLRSLRASKSQLRGSVCPVATGFQRERLFC